MNTPRRHGLSRRFEPVKERRPRPVHGARHVCAALCQGAGSWGSHATQAPAREAAEEGKSARRPELEARGYRAVPIPGVEERRESRAGGEQGLLHRGRPTSAGSSTASIPSQATFFSSSRQGVDMAEFTASSTSARPIRIPRPTTVSTPTWLTLSPEAANPSERISRFVRDRCAAAR